MEEILTRIAWVNENLSPSDKTRLKNFLENPSTGYVSRYLATKSDGPLEHALIFAEALHLGSIFIFSGEFFQEAFAIVEQLLELYLKNLKTSNSGPFFLRMFRILSHYGIVGERVNLTSMKLVLEYARLQVK